MKTARYSDAQIMHCSAGDVYIAERGHLEAGGGRVRRSDPAEAQPPSAMEARAIIAAMLPVATPERPAPTVQPPANTPPIPIKMAPAV